MKGLKPIRMARGYTQVVLATKLNVSQSTVAEWESGAIFPSGSKVPEIADALECSIDARYGREAVRSGGEERQLRGE